MVIKKFHLVLALSVAVAANSSSTSLAKAKNVITAAGGALIPSLGLVIDASYDPRLDGFVPGYRVINVAVINESLNIIYLDPARDKWWIKLKGRRRPIRVIHDLRSYDPKAWASIPERARGLVSYPLILPVGARHVVDIFVTDDIDAANFTELKIFLKSLDVRFDILSRQ